MPICGGCKRNFKTQQAFSTHLTQTRKQVCINFYESHINWDEPAGEQKRGYSDQHNLIIVERGPPEPSPVPFEGDYFGDYLAEDFDNIHDEEVAPPAGLNEAIRGKQEREVDGLQPEECDQPGRAGEVWGDQQQEGEHGLERDDEEGGDDDDEEDEGDDDDADEYEDDDLPGWEPPPLNLPDDRDLPVPMDEDLTVNALDQDARQRIELQASAKTFVEHFPSAEAGKVYANYGAGPNSQRVYAASVGITEKEPFAPFKSKLDWEIARWAKLRGPGATAFTDLLKIKNVSVVLHCKAKVNSQSIVIQQLVELLGLSYKTSQQLDQLIDKLPSK